ncbi:sarcosine oxidase subunit gamma [Pseudomonas flavescens]|uniref:Sarcosine oxidase subunit gamma n=1 Tax=Phytopseudomonas flavescens TaxID=29435 RepID=A0A1G8MY28_9GAMM|nr:sarcosine oxidase subunit gamma family protein [Pseudomonas flavescens]SDI72735.1 sarcosine oxidase subunit gamma [Pseudomonas flavescens]
MTAANVYQQRPDDLGIKVESPLHHAGFNELLGKGKSGAGVTLREKKLQGHLTLRGDGRDAAFAEGVHKALGLELPSALRLVVDGQSSLQWMSPDEFLIIVPRGEELATERKLRESLAGQHVQVVNVSGGQTILELSGPNARDVLMKSTSYDVHPSQFPVGKAVGSNFAKTSLYIRHTAPDTWELLVRRSFADYIWAWLQDAAGDYGLAIEQ